jgi:hypothetical protein
MYAQRLLATDRYEENGNSNQAGYLASWGPGNNVHEKSGNVFSKAANKFYKWWGKQADAKFFSKANAKKTSVMAAAGFAVGAPAALAGTVLLGPVAAGAVGAFAAGRIAKAVMSSHLSKKSKGEKHIDSLDQDFGIEDMVRTGQASNIGDVIDEQTDREVSNNRKRLGVSIGAAAISGAVGAAGAEHFLGWGANHHSGGGHSDGSAEKPADGHSGGNHHHHSQSGRKGGGEADEYGDGKDNELELNYYGDNPEHEIANYMNQHGLDGSNQADLQKLTQTVLDHNGIDWDQAHHLPIGYKFKIPQAAMEELAKRNS